jgi:N utilization substance protein B
MARHRARLQALQLLFQWDLRRGTGEELTIDQMLKGYYGSLLIDDDHPENPVRDPFAEILLRGAIGQIESIDATITRHAEHWKIQRMPAVDRNVLRLAVYELLHTETPAAVAIDEALELARQFSGEESVHFVNGVLDAVRKESAPAAPATA